MRGTIIEIKSRQLHETISERCFTIQVKRKDRFGTMKKYVPELVQVPKNIKVNNTENALKEVP